jgi:site-specific DNA-cytosine methylase
MDPAKVRLYDAAAAVMTPPSPPAIVADITDAAFFTAERIMAWGPLNLIVSSIPCTSLSSLGLRLGIREKSVAAFIRGLLRIIGLALAPIVLLECTRGLESDERFQKALIKPLQAMGYSITWTTLDARHWVGAVRLRLYLVAFRSVAACEAFKFPSRPACREIRLYSVILPAFRPGAPPGTHMAPASSYFITRLQTQKLAAAMVAAHRAGRKEPTAKQRERALTICDRELSIVGRSAAMLPFVRGREVSRVVTFHFNRATAIEHTYGVAPTLTKSGCYLLRDKYGPRMMTGAECAALHGIPPRVIEAFSAVASSGQIVAAVGDGFAIPVVRDLLKAALRAAAAADDGE